MMMVAVQCCRNMYACYTYTFPPLPPKPWGPGRGSRGPRANLPNSASPRNVW